MGTEAGPQRTHTGRRRNEAARQAIVDAAAELLMRSDLTAVTIETIAAHAGVGRQTIYRWWPSKGAVLLEAMVERARRAVPAPDTGTLLGDLDAFLTATFRAGSHPATTALLRSAMAEALRDPHAAEVLHQFTADRRSALREVLDRAYDRGDVAPDSDRDLLMDQAFGVLWYRVLLGREPLSHAAASDLAAALASQARTGRYAEKNRPQTPETARTRRAKTVDHGTADAHHRADHR